MLGADDGGEAALVYTWTATGPAGVTFSVNGTNASKASTATFTAAGSYVVTATVKDAQNVTVTSAVTVTVSQTLTIVVVTPASATVGPSATQQFTASGKDQFGATLTAQPAFTWMTTGGGTISATGLFAAGATAGGPFTVTATSGAKSGTASVTVSAGAAPTVATAAAATPNPTSTTTTAVSALGADDGGEPALVYTWSATGPAAATFSANGTNASKASTATFTAAGSYMLTVTIKDATNQTVTSAVSVTVNQTLTTVAVTPASPTIGVGATQQFTASGKDQFGATLTAQPAFTWMTTGGGTISGTGLFTAGATAGGPFAVTATSGAKSGTASITVTAGAAPTIATAASATPNPTGTATTAVSALGADDGGEPALVYTWSATGPAAVVFSANGSNASKASTATFTAAGTYSFTVTIKDATNQTVTSVVSVTVNQTLTTVAVTPASATVGLSATQQFTASAKDQFGATLTSQPAFTWTTSGGGTINSSGLLTAGATVGGPFTVTGSSGGKSGTANLTVTAGNAPTVATAAAATPNLVAGSTTALAALGADDGGEASLTYTWSASGPAPITFSTNATNPAKASTATFTRAGTYVLTVTITDGGGQTTTSTVSVTVQQTLTTATVTPATTAVSTSGAFTFVASAADQFGNALATQPAFTWTVSGGGTINAAGTFTASATTGGPFTVTASSGGKSGTASVTVVAGAAPTVATAVSANPNPVLATTTTLSVLGADDGGEAALTYTWSATGPAPVTFSANASNAAKSSVATFIAVGSYAFTVTIKDAQNFTVLSTVAVTVQPTQSVLTVAPAMVTLLVGATQQFTAALVDQFGGALVPGALSWGATGGGSISASGLFTAASAGGPFTVTATSGATAGTAQVTVGAPVDVTPPAVALISPLEGASVAGQVMLEATATDDVGVARVEFFVDGTSVGVALAAPWVLAWDASAAAQGVHRLLARATDTSGNLADSIQVSVRIDVLPGDTTAPRIAITAPKDAAIIDGSVTVTAEAQDEVGVVQVIFRLDGVKVATLTQAPWTVVLEPRAVPVGKHVLTADAQDAAGNRGDAAPVSFERTAPREVGGVVSCGCTSTTSAAPWMLLGFVMLLRARRGRSPALGSSRR